MKTAYVTHSDCSRHDTGWAHPEHQGRLPAVARAVYRDMLTLFDSLLQVEAEPASGEDLLLAHDPGYMERVLSAVVEAGEAGRVLELEGGARVSGASWAAAVAAAGSVITAVDLVLRGGAANAFCAVRPPGSGASRDRSTGFALFNSVAIAALHLRERRGVERVLIVEWGARAGRGTAEIVAGDPGIRFATVHQAEDGAAPWPAGVVAEAVAPGSGVSVVAAALERAMEAALDGFDPGFILLSAGFDLLKGDPIGDLAVAPEEVYGLTRQMVERAAFRCDGRLVSVLEGGFEPRLLGDAVVQHLRALAGLAPA